MDFITSVEAARLLKVKPETLYAYVSRGWLRSYGRNANRQSIYSRQDVEVLKLRQRRKKGAAAAASTALRFGEPVLDSSITKITPDGPRYRGFRAIDLVLADYTFEQVVELVWSGVLTERLIHWQSGIDATASFNAPKDDGSYVYRWALNLLSQVCLTGSYQNALADEETKLMREILVMLADQFQNDKKGYVEKIASCFHGVDEEFLRACMIFCIDHELTPSAFAVRVAASTGADLPSSLSAGIAVMSGSRHGASFERVHQFLQRVRTVPKKNRLECIASDQNSGSILNHSLYPTGDPRAKYLITYLEESPSLKPDVRMGIDLYNQTIEHSIGHFMIDYPIVLFAYQYHIPIAKIPLVFLSSRLAGFFAHILEQRASGFMVRPRARYVGR